MGEFKHNDVNEGNTHSSENYKEIKPKKEMSVTDLNDAISNEFNKASKEVIYNFEKNDSEKNLDPNHKDCLTTSEEREEWADRSDGEWDGEHGNSKFYPEKQEAKGALEKYNLDGVDYNDGEPDFSKVSEATVEIDNMTSERYGPGKNFEQADQRCADKWNKEGRDGRTDWKAREVADWRSENCYSWHERLDRKTMDLVQRDIHEACKHKGGVCECNRHEALEKSNGGVSDE